MNEIDQLKKNTKILTENHIQDQQQEFKKIIPKVEYVLKKHSNILTSDELQMLKLFYRYITNKETSLDYSTINTVKSMVNWLSRV